jgi:hypothetical protein
MLSLKKKIGMNIGKTIEIIEDVFLKFSFFLSTENKYVIHVFFNCKFSEYRYG